MTRPFALFVPEGLEEAVAVSAAHGAGARPLAGGTVLIPDLGTGRARPDAVVDLQRCGLDTISAERDRVRVGATAKYRRLELEPGLLGAFAHAVTGGAQVRNRATVGGSAAYANPSSDAPAVLLALEATLVVRSAAAERRIPAGDFFVDAFRTALRPGELLIGFEFTPPEAAGYSKLKFGESSWPIVTAAAVRRSGRVRVAVGGAAAVPFAVEGAVVGEVEEAVRAALVEPWSDVLASAAYRRRVAPVIARRAVESLN